MMMSMSKRWRRRMAMAITTGGETFRKLVAHHWLLGHTSLQERSRLTLIGHEPSKVLRLGLDDQRANHPGACGFIGVRMAVERIRPGLRGLEQRHVALTGRYDRMHVEL